MNLLNVLENNILNARPAKHLIALSRKFYKYNNKGAHMLDSIIIGH